MLCRPLTLDEESLWDTFVESSPFSGFMQASFWENFKKRTGWDSISLGLFDDEQLVGGAIVLRFHFAKNRHFLYIPQGPVLNYDRPNADKIFLTIVENIKKNLVSGDAHTSTASHLRIEPRITHIPSYFSEFHRASFDIQPSSTILIDLTKSEKGLLANMKPKGRYNIGIAQRHGVTVDVQPFTQENLQSFYELYLETSRHHGFTPQPLVYFSSMMTPQDSSHYFFAFARHGSRIVSAALVVRSGNSATYFYGASSSDVPELMASYLLQWEVMCYAKYSDCKTYDLWGVASDDTPKNHPWIGFSKFKEKFGGEVVHFIGAHDLVLHEPAYEDYLAQSGEKPMKRK